MRNITFIIVVLLFALAGASDLRMSLTHFSKGIRAGWPGDRDEIYSGLFDLASGTALISVAYGLHRRDYRARAFAIILSGLALAVTIALTLTGTLAPVIQYRSGLALVLFMFASELFVVICLLLPSVREQFL